MLFSPQIVALARKRAPVATLANWSANAKIGTLTSSGGLAVLADGITSATTGSGQTARTPTGGTTEFGGVDWGSGNSYVVTRFIIYGPSNTNLTVGAGGTFTYTLYGKNTAPANSTDGTALTSGASAALTTAEVIDVTAGITLTTAYRYHWVGISSVPDCAIAEIQFYILA